MKLRDQLLNVLKDLPGTRRFHLHVLLSAPHKYASLFPYASVRPRVYAQNILILCSEERIKDAEPSSLDSEAEPEPPRVFVTAIEATLFHIPSTSSAILYVAKVDSTGQGARPAPTSVLVRALVAFYAHPATRPAKLRGTTLWVHLFARAERQYLFPNSADHPGKKPLSDVKLCAWWKRVLGRVVQEVGVGGTKMFYVLPGMGELEASQALGETIGSTSKGTHWTYGHPYSQTDVSLPYSATSKAREDGFNLGQLIPSFDDDPKSRFMDEIACTTQVDGLRSPQRKRRRTETGTKEAEEKKEKEKETRIQGELGKVDADEFWERMSFRQECVAGAVTGFFVLIFPSGTDSSSPLAATVKDNLSTNPLAPQPGEVSHHLVQRVLKSLMKGHEFSNTEHSLKCTSILENSIRGLCSGMHVPDLPTQKEKPQFLGGDESEEQDKDKEKEGSPPPQFLALPSTPPRRTIPLGGPNEDISPNPFPEPEPSADAYASFIYGAVGISNPDAPTPSTTTVVAANGNGNGTMAQEGASAVTVLAVRKKKRK